jgi:signal transduction histidine kinase
MGPASPPRRAEPPSGTGFDVLSRVVTGPSAKGTRGWWTLRRSITGLFVVLVGLLVLDSVAAVRAFGQRRDADRQEEELAGLSFAAAAVGQAYVEQEAAARGYVIAGLDRFLVPFEEGRQRAADLTALLRETLDDEQSLAELGEVEAAAAQWRTEAADRQIELRRSGQVQEANALVASGIGAQLFDELRAQLDDLAAAISAAILGEREASRDAQDRVTAIVVFSSVIAALVAIGAFILLRRSLTRPLGVLLDRIGAVSSGDLSAEVPAIGPPELRTLGGAVETMRQRILDDASRRAESALIAGQEEERRRIAGALHDDQVQALPASGLFMQRVRKRVKDPETAELIGQAELSLKETTQRLRSMMFELHSPVLDAEGLVAALEVFLYETADELAWKISGTVHPETPQVMQALAYRLTKEALSNVIRHASASNLTVNVESSDSMVQVTTVDDGAGFDVDERLVAEPGHLGMGHAKALAGAVGGRWDVTSAPGEGTTVVIRLPFTRAENGAEE